MIYYFYRDAFSEVYTYGYRLTDLDGQLKAQANWPGTGVKEYPEQIFFEDAQGERRAYLQWEDRSWWRGDRFYLRTENGAQTIATLEENWTIVDRMLLHLPAYLLTLADGNRLKVHGSRYGERFYQISVLPGDAEVAPETAEFPLGEITKPSSGPTYVVRTKSPLLIAAPLLLTAMIVVLDMWGLKKAQKA